MKLIHLSDLHIGRRFQEISLLEDQQYILDQILHMICREQPDAVLICGDVYDKSVPSAEAVTLFDDFLYRLSGLDTQVMIISGNHDSPERLAFGGRLMNSRGIHISPVYNGALTPVKLTDEHGPVYFWLLPFVKPAHVRKHFPEESIESYTDAVRVAVEKLDLDTGVRNVLLTHQFVIGCTTCDSEEISVGGSDHVDAAVFADFDYVALGHIHGPQNIGSNRIRYCGTPLKYSFSECSHHKSVTVVKLGAKGKLELDLQPLTPRRDMRRIRGSFAQLTDKANYSGTALDDYLHAILTDETDVPEAMGQLRMIYPNLLQLTYDNTRTRADRIVDGVEQVQNRSKLELFEELYEKQNNQPMSREQRSLVQTLIEEIWEGQV